MTDHEYIQKLELRVEVWMARAKEAEAALATAEHCGKDYATERACGKCLHCLRTMCEIEAEGNCNRTMEICALQAALATAREQLMEDTDEN